MQSRSPPLFERRGVDGGTLPEDSDICPDTVPRRRDSLDPSGGAVLSTGVQFIEIGPDTVPRRLDSLES